jgi:predicted amidophosphoribosyltransferase
MIMKGDEGPSLPLQRLCPFCPAQIAGDRCASCGRDPTVRRRTCGACSRFTPYAEPVCCHCKAKVSSGTAKTVITIVLVIVILNVVGLIVQLALH